MFYKYNKWCIKFSNAKINSKNEDATFCDFDGFNLTSYFHQLSLEK